MPDMPHHTAYGEGRSQSSLPRLLHRIEAALCGKEGREFLAGDLTVLKLHAEAATLGEAPDAHPVMPAAAEELVAAIREVRDELREAAEGPVATGDRLLRAAWLMIGAGSAGWHPTALAPGQAPRRGIAAGSTYVVEALG